MLDAAASPSYPEKDTIFRGEMKKNAIILTKATLLCSWFNDEFTGHIAVGAMIMGL